MKNNLKYWRIRRGLTLRELGEKTGVKKANLSSIENGLTGPSIKLAVKLANELNVTLDQLFNIK